MTTSSSIGLWTAVALAVALPAAVRAQAPTDFSGTWVLDAARSDEPTGGGRGGGGTRLVIEQDAAMMTVTEGARVLRYHFDGSETVLPPGGETKATARWEDGRLVVDLTREYFAGPDVGYATTTGQDVYARSGDVLTIDKTSTDRRGRTTMTRFVYTKS